MVSTNFIADANAAEASGWYKTTAEAANVPVARGAILRVDSYNDSWKHQTWFYTTDGGCTLERYKLNGTWGEWEWVNPPMAVGVEYRTTERMNGKPVYVKCVDIGYLPNNTTKQVALYASADLQYTYQPIGFYGYAYVDSSYIALPYLNTIFLCASDGRIIISTTANYSNWAGSVTVKYTKSTD